MVKRNVNSKLVDYNLFKNKHCNRKYCLNLCFADFPYCINHKCSIVQCQKKVYKNSPYCIKHKCEEKDCKDKKEFYDSFTYSSTCLNH